MSCLLSHGDNILIDCFISENINLKINFQTELDKTLNELKQAEESSKKVAADVARLQEELRNEQHHNDHVERQKRGLDAQLKVP